MLRIGLTGGIGSGKSTVAKQLVERGYPVVDADQVARDIVAPGQPALVELVKSFGEEILQADGTLDRGALARKAFVDRTHTELLNAITHPAIEAEVNRRFDTAEAAGEPVMIYDMPLLVDKNLHLEMGLVVVVDVGLETRVERLTSARGLDPDDVRRRIAAQVDDTTRLAAAHVVIDNNGELEDLAPQIESLIQEIDERVSTAPETPGNGN